MNSIVTASAELLQLLPEADQRFAYAFIQKLVLAWDPDFTKLAAEERERLTLAEQSGFVDESEIDWEHLEKYT